MGKVLFKNGKVQIGDRIKIPKAIVDTLDLEAGQKIIIKFDPDKRTLLIQEEKE